MTYFYSHIISMETVIDALDQMELEDHHRVHLANMIDACVHNLILDVILSQLSAADKKVFLARLLENPQDKKILEFLNAKIDKVEDQIKKVGEDFKHELHKDIENSFVLKP